MKKLLKCLPWFFVALFATEVVMVLMPKKDGEFHTREFGRLPVLLGGRIQPFDSVARNSLLQIRSTGDVLAFAPPLIIQKSEIDQLFATAREVLRSIA